jgi:bifunctional non-homologous end joining protein LigD
VIDGEIVALDREGRPSFQALHHRRTAAHALVYYAFDLLSLDDESLIRKPLDARRQRLRSLVAGSNVLLSEPLPGSPRHIEAEIRRIGLEGVVAKRRDSPYVLGQRTPAWVKVKFSPQQEFVIGGYKPSSANFESVLVGYFNKKKLYFAGKVRAGLTPHMRADIHDVIAARPIATCPFVNLPNSDGKRRWGEGITGEDMKKLEWVKPTVVIEVAFVEWTDDGLLRHAKFVGLRPDKKAGEVVRET